MAAEYITIEGQKYRVSHNFATLEMFSQMTGRTTLEQMSELDRMSPGDLLTMMFCAIYMGEKKDGREFGMESPQELGLCVGVGDMQEYVQIFARQMRSDIKPERVSTEVKKKIPFWRRLRG